MNDMKNLIKETIVDMIKNGDLQIETDIIEGNYDKQLVTTVYYFSDDMFVREKIQEYKSSIK